MHSIIILQWEDSERIISRAWLNTELGVEWKASGEGKDWNETLVLIIVNTGQETGHIESRRKEGDSPKGA